jgi:hypothetical protein
VRHGQQAHLQPDTTRPADTAGLSETRPR